MSNDRRKTGVQLINLCILLIFFTGYLYPADPVYGYFNPTDSAYKKPDQSWFVRKQFLPASYRWLSLGVEAGIMSSPEYNHTMQFSLTSGRYINISNYIQLSGSFGWSSLRPSSSLNNIIGKDIKLYNISLEFKTLLPSYKIGIIQYFLFGFGVDFFSFKYKEPIEAEYREIVEQNNWEVNYDGDYDDGEFDDVEFDNNSVLACYRYLHEVVTIKKIQEDYIGAFNIHAGLGFNIGEINNCQICSEITPGYIFPSTTTHYGMENIFLKGSFCIKLKLSVYFPYNEI